MLTIDSYVCEGKDEDKSGRMTKVNRVTFIPLLWQQHNRTPLKTLTGLTEHTLLFLPNKSPAGEKSH